MSEVAAVVIDPARVDGPRIFRPDRVSDRPVIVARALAERLGSASGISFRHLPR